ncbi:MAG: Rpn family recombination-promoting nuclease/putative transposase, partial [Bacteroidales bacterium]|nr:Rpn family recombination-promoting nuclease/putative transposase [Bacteroidales bacterium]
VTHAKLKYAEYPEELYSDKLEFINIEMPKFNKTEDELQGMLDKWFFAMKNLYHLADRPKALREGIFKKLFNLAEIAKYKDPELLAYRDSLKDYRDYYSTIEYAEIKGVAKGRAEGRAEGKAEERISIAKALKASNVPIDIIISSTGLTTDEINKL